MRTRRRPRDGGYTMVEVMMAVIIGMIGLMGTVALQQTMVNATQQANDYAIAQRLAMQKMEEFDAAPTNPGPPVIDGLCWRWRSSGGATPAKVVQEYVDSQGRVNPGGATTRTSQYRFLREWRVDVDTATVPPAPPAPQPAPTAANNPYNIYIRVSYNTDFNDPTVTQAKSSRTIEMDAQRQKTWLPPNPCP